LFLLCKYTNNFKVPSVIHIKTERSIHSPSCYASVLDLLHEDPKLSSLLTPQANYAKTKAAPLWLEQLKCDNHTYPPYATKLLSAN
jgi:hypothetical protein